MGSDRSASSWNAQKERGSPAMVRLIRWIALRLGRTPARALLYPITAYFLLFAPQARRASRSYLARRFGRPVRTVEVFRHIHCFAATVLDRVYFLTGRDDELDVRVHGLEAFKRALDSDRGVLLISAHLGSFEALRTLTRQRPNLKLRILMDANQNRAITDLLHELAPDIAATVIPVEGFNGLLSIHEALTQGALVGMMGDRINGNEPAVTSTLLNAPVAMPRGPFTLPLITGAPLFFGFGLYRGGNRYDLHFEAVPLAQPVSRGERNQRIQQLVDQFAQRIEHHLHSAPYNWFNFYDFWSQGDDSLDQHPTRRAAPHGDRDHGGACTVAAGGKRDT